MTIASPPPHAIYPHGLWRLEHLFASDTAAIAEMTALSEDAKAFSDEFSDRLSEADGPAWLSAWTAFEELSARHDRVNAFLSLRHLGSLNDGSVEELRIRLDAPERAYWAQVSFIFAAWRALSEERERALLDFDGLELWAQYLSSLRPLARRNRSPQEISAFSRREQTASRSWRELHQETISSLRFTVEHAGVSRQVGISERRSLIRSPERATRRAYMDSFYGTLGPHQHVLARCFDAVIADRVASDRFGGYAAPMARTEEQERIPEGFIAKILEMVRGRYGLYRRWVRLRASLGGTERLSGYDLDAPVWTGPLAVSYSEVQRMLQDCVAAFPPRVAAYVEQLFADGHVDAEPGAHKSGTIGCRPAASFVPPFITMTYSDDRDSAMTLAHEVGHALHRGLSGETFGAIRMRTGTILGETAASFLERAMGQRLLECGTSEDERLRLRIAQLGDVLYSVMTQTRMALFEVDAYELKRKGQFLSAQRLTELWNAHTDEQHGDTVVPFPGMERHWSAVPHFIDSRFYTPSYVISDLAVARLMSDYRDEPERTSQGVMCELLMAGGSRSPEHIFGALGLDVADIATWERGLVALERELADLEALAEGAPLARAA